MGLFAKKRRGRTLKELNAYLTELQPLIEDARLLKDMGPELPAALARSDSVLGANHPMTLQLGAVWARALAVNGRLTEAATQAHTVLQFTGRNEASSLSLHAWFTYAWVVGDEGRHREAADELEGMSRLRGSTPYSESLRRRARGERLVELCFAGLFHKAETEARAIADDPATDPETLASVLNTLSMSVHQLQRPAEAEVLARWGLAVALPAQSASDRTPLTLRANLSMSLSAQGRADEALDVLPETDGTHSALSKARGTALLALGRPADAAEVARAGLAIAATKYGERHHRVRSLRTLLAHAEAEHTAG